MTVLLRKEALKSLVRIVVDQQAFHPQAAFQSLSLAPRDEAFIQALVLGVIRFYFPLKTLLSQFLDKPLKNKDRDIECLLLMGLYEILDFRTPDHAVLNETQKAVPKTKTWAKGLINAVLRRALEKKETLSLLNQPPFPDWLTTYFKTHYPAETPEIIQAHQAPPPFHLRVKGDRQSYLRRHPEFKGESPVFFPFGLTLKTPCPASQIPGFLEGEISIQDLAPQKTVELLDLSPGLKVLDTCAAPGGKSAHLLEACPDIQLTCWDIHPERIQKIHENFKRLKLNTNSVQVTVHDATKPSSFEAESFDRILIDAPCSGLGVIRRHPEIALHRSLENLNALAEIQLQLLKQNWPLLKEGGILLYATCSITQEENDGVIKAFLAQTRNAENETLALNHPEHRGQKTSYGYQFLPTPQGPDGFFYAKLRKKPS